MQNVIKIIIVCVLSLSLYAQENKFTTSVAIVSMSMDYREYDSSGAILDSEVSDFNDLAGLDLGISYVVFTSSKETTKIDINLLMLGGYTVYTGSLLGSGNPYGSYIEHTANSIIDVDIALSTKRVISDSLKLKYTFGLGYYFWERALSTTQVEDYIWYSLRGMVGLEYQMTKKLQLGLDLEYQYGFNETMYASNLGTTFDLGGVDTLQLSIPLLYSYNEKMDFYIIGVYEKQVIKASNIVGGYYEPDSTAKNQYIKIGANFKF